MRKALEAAVAATLGADLTAAERVAAGSERDFVAAVLDDAILVVAALDDTVFDVAVLDFAVLAFAGLVFGRAGVPETDFDVRLAELALAFCLLMVGLVWLNK